MLWRTLASCYKDCYIFSLRSYDNYDGAKEAVLALGFGLDVRLGDILVFVLGTGLLSAGLGHGIVIRLGSHDGNTR